MKMLTAILAVVILMASAISDAADNTCENVCETDHDAAVSSDTSGTQKPAYEREAASETHAAVETEEPSTGYSSYLQAEPQNSDYFRDSGYQRQGAFAETATDQTPYAVGLIVVLPAK